ncbi:hypothetical protein D932_03526 [Enterococcus casseliflavus 14-MB-W-14]|nr:hypothetical protein D932_03526 [Enterococcus casseliflavus 14-MB-W-14]
MSRPSVPLASRFTFFKNSKLFKSIPIDTYTYFFHNKKTNSQIIPSKESLLME